jgi:flagellar biosynthesis protein FliR
MTAIESLALLAASEVSRAVTAVSVLNLPGFRQVPVRARVFLGVLIALCCFSAKWASGTNTNALSEGFWAICARNLVTGLAVALLWNLVLDACALTVQLASVQSGLSYASIIDPTNDTESGSLLALTQFCLLITFLASGIHLEFLSALLMADSMWEGFSRTGPTLAVLKDMFAYSFRTGLRLAAPFIASMLIFDMASALAGRFAERFQISILIFPIKWIATLLLLLASTATLHRLEVDFAAHALGHLGGRP